MCVGLIGRVVVGLGACRWWLIVTSTMLVTTSSMLNSRVLARLSRMWLPIWMTLISSCVVLSRVRQLLNIDSGS